MKLIKKESKETATGKSRVDAQRKKSITSVKEGDYNIETGAPVSNLSVPVISNETAFKAAIEEINVIMNKGDGNLTQEETNRLRMLSLAVRNFDRATYSIERPKTLGAVLDLQKYQRGWKQIQMARALGISEAKLSLIISGRQKPDVFVLKAIHEKLGVDGNFILEVI
jgi:HTH-type transcriptional regulator / antitoxin HigA